MENHRENGEELAWLNQNGTTDRENDQSVEYKSYGAEHRWKMVFRQIFATVTVNLLSLAYGISVGWAAPNTVLFLSEESPIGVLNSSQISWIASILCIGGLVGTIIFGCIVDIFGRKMVMISIAIPQIAANILVLIGTHYYYIYVARFLFGLAAGGVFIMVPIFVSEITYERIRGALGSLFCMMNNSGIVLGYIISSWMDYYKMPYVAIVITCLFLVIFIWFPDSPDYLAHQNRAKEAKKAYAFYGNIRSPPRSENPMGEKNAELLQPLGTQTIANTQKITLNDFKDKAVQRGIFISIMLIIFADTTGVFAITHFMTELFEAAKMEIDIYVATVVVGLIQILGSVVSILTVDRFGRRILFIISAGGTAICLFTFGGYYFLLDRSADNVSEVLWLPVASLCGVILIASVAVSTLPFSIISELMPLKVRGFVVTWCFTISWLFAFAILHFFHLMVDLMGIAGTMWTYGVCCVIEVFFIYFFLPETKNLTFEEIQTKLRTLKV